MDALKKPKPIKRKNQQSKYAPTQKKSSKYSYIQLLSVFGMAILVIMLWFASFKINFQRLNKNEVQQNNNFNQIKDRFSKIINQTSLLTSSMKSISNTNASSSTSSIPLSPEMLEKLQTQIKAETN